MFSGIAWQEYPASYQSSWRAASFYGSRHRGVLPHAVPNRPNPVGTYRRIRNLALHLTDRFQIAIYPFGYTIHIVRLKCPYGQRPETTYNYLYPSNNKVGINSKWIQRVAW